MYIVTHAPSIHNNSHFCKAGGDTGVWHGSTERHTEVHNRRPDPRVRIKRLVSKRDQSALATDEPLHQNTHDPLLFLLDHYCKLFFFHIISRKFSPAVRAGSTLIKQNPIAQYERCINKIGKQWGYTAFFQEGIPRSCMVWKFPTLAHLFVFRWCGYVSHKCL